MKVVLGKSMTGKIYYLPLDPRLDEVPSHLTCFSSQEILEILCIIEFLLMRRKRQRSKDDIYQVTYENYFECLNEMREKGHLDKEIDNAGLRTSVDRLRLGMLLSL